MCFSSGGDGGAADRARADEVARQERVRTGVSNVNSKFSEFDDSFYNKRSQDYKDFAAPDVARQYKDTQSGILYGLARSGNLASSERARQLGVVNRERDLANMRVTDKATEYANQARSNVEQNRTDLINQVQATGDSNLAANQAQMRAASIRPSPAFEGLGSLFNTSGAIINKAKQTEYYNPYAPGMNALNPFGNKQGSSSQTINK